MKRNDWFILSLLFLSLGLNVYLGLTIKRTKAASATPPSGASAKLKTGTVVQPLKATDLRGKEEVLAFSVVPLPTVLYVFSPSCMWCERNNENINALASQRKDSFRFIGLSLTDEGLASYVESHHLSFPVYRRIAEDSRQILGLGTTPETIVVAPDGKIIKNWIGAFSGGVQPDVEEFFKIKLPGLKEPTKQN